LSGVFAVEYRRGEIDEDLRYLWGPQHEQKAYPLPSNVSQLTFAEQGTGTFLLPFPFRGDLEMEYTLEVKKGHVSAVLLSSSEGKSYLGVSFGNIELFREGSKVPPPLTEECR